MLGYDSPEEVLCSVTNISTQIYVDSERRMNSMESTLKAGHDDIEVQFKRKDGSIGWLMNSVRVVRNEQGEIKYFEGITKDITDRKRTEEKLNNHMEFITTLINTIPSPVFYKDVAGKYLGCNRAFEEFFGKSRSFILGKTTYDIAPAAIANEYREKDLELFGHHGTQTYEGKVAAPDGSIRDVLISKATYTDTSKNVAGLIGVLIDITDRKRAAEALDEERRQLKQALDEIRTLRGIVPICANCKKIRDDKGYWNHVEKYISEHTGAKFSHGICPDCVKELYPEFYEEKQADDKL